MKKYFLVAASMLSVLAVNAQKDELKAASKALKKGDAATAIQALNPIAEIAKSADDKTKANFYALYGQASLQLAQAGEGDYTPAIESYEAIIAMNEAKYIEEANQALKTISNELFNVAVELQSENNYRDAATKIYESYLLSKNDTIRLYYAAGSAFNGNDYESALKYYNELININYDGSSVIYKATNIDTDEVVSFGADKEQRDLLVNVNQFKNPSEEEEPSKKKDILIYMATIYKRIGNIDEAVKTYEDAIIKFPNDSSFLINLADIYYQSGNNEKFEELLKKAIELEPNNPDLYYNIGVISMDKEDFESARINFDRALELDEMYVNALLNKSTTFIMEARKFLQKMDELPFSAEAEYLRLKAEREKVLLKAAEVIENELERFDDNPDCLNQLVQIYSAIGDEENVSRIKKLLQQ
jgi:tetratricopeptide (TPR) repeat protein